MLGSRIFHRWLIGKPRSNRLIERNWRRNDWFLHPSPLPPLPPSRRIERKQQTTRKRTNWLIKVRPCAETGLKSCFICDAEYREDASRRGFISRHGFISRNFSSIRDCDTENCVAKSWSFTWAAICAIARELIGYKVDSLKTCTRSMAWVLNNNFTQKQNAKKIRCVCMWRTKL